MSQLRKRKAKNKKFKEQTTFNPKLHYKTKGSTGYGLRSDAENNDSGSQLEHILNPK